MSKISSKAFSLFIMLIVPVFIFGCSSDDDDNDSSPSSDDDSIVDDTAGDDSGTTDDTDDDTDIPALSIIFDFPPVAPGGAAYEYQFEAEGGVPPYSAWTVVAGTIPAGTALDSDTGLLSGTPTDTEKLYYFVLQVGDSAGNTAQEAFGIRIGDPSEEGPLQKRARDYQEIYLLRHNSDGLTVTSDNPDDPGGDYWFSDLGDACFIHGNASAGAAFRYAVEQTDEALVNARLHVRGLDLLNRVNGVPGLMSRSYMPQDGPMAPNEFTTFWPDSDNHVGEGEFADYYWKGDVSIDQYSGALVGLSMLYDLVPDETVRETVKSTVVEIADYLWDGGLIIYDAHGEPTTYGDFRGDHLEGYPVFNGLGAAACLAWFKLAHHVSGDLRFKEHYEFLVNVKNYDWILSKFLWVYLGYKTKHYNVYMGFENMFALTRLEDDPVLKAEYADAFARELWESTGDALRWRRGRVEANPTFTPWYLYSTGRRDPVAIMNSIWEMDMFVEAPLRDRYIENSANPDIEKNPERPQDALYPLPANLRVPDMCIWHRSPYGLDGGEDNGRERSGHDYLLPYWMGRYYGYISPDW